MKTNWWFTACWSVQRGRSADDNVCGDRWGWREEGIEDSQDKEEEDTLIPGAYQYPPSSLILGQMLTTHSWIRWVKDKLFCKIWFCWLLKEKYLFSIECLEPYIFWLNNEKVSWRRCSVFRSNCLQMTVPWLLLFLRLINDHTLIGFFC